MIKRQRMKKQSGQQGCNSCQFVLNETIKMWEIRCSLTVSSLRLSQQKQRHQAEIPENRTSLASIAIEKTRGYNRLHSVILRGTIFTVCNIKSQQQVQEGAHLLELLHLYLCLWPAESYLLGAAATPPAPRPTSTRLLATA